MDEEEKRQGGVEGMRKTRGGGGRGKRGGGLKMGGPAHSYFPAHSEHARAVLPRDCPASSNGNIEELA